MKARTNPVGYSKSRWITTGLDSSPCWRTNCTRRVSIGKTHTLGRQPIEIGRLIVATSLTGKIHPTEVIDQNQNEVHGFFGLSTETQEKEEGYGKENFHGINGFVLAALVRAICGQFIGQSTQLGHDLRVLLGEVGGLSEVLLQVV